MTITKGIHDWVIHQTPIAIVDFETTGLTPGLDRVVEISVYKIEPGKSPYLAFDTLVNPSRPMAATEIHGISDADVAGAPVFKDMAGDFIDVLSGCVVAAYNVYFDIKFLEYELSQIKISTPVPHFCLMYMRPLLSLGCRCNLEHACQEHNIDYPTAHIAAVDARASAGLMEFYLQVLADQDIRTFGQLASLKNYKFFQSFIHDPLPIPSAFQLSQNNRRLSRARDFSVSSIDPAKQAIQKYWDALRMVLTDLKITADEQAAIIEIRSRLQIPKEQIRMLHARAFASVICQSIDDKWLDDKEAQKLQRLFVCLSKLGWAPGE
jgi:DNA polymerase III subunit epsilon